MKLSIVNNLPGVNPVKMRVGDMAVVTQGKWCDCGPGDVVLRTKSYLVNLTKCACTGTVDEGASPLRVSILSPGASVILVQQ